MNAIARARDEQAIRQIAAYFGTVGEPPPADTGSGNAGNAPRLVLYGDTHRGIASCQSCHNANNTDRRVMMAPVLEGQRADYLARQLGLFQTEWHNNDVYRPMREIAARLTGDEIDRLAAGFGARPPAEAPGPALSNGTVSARLAGR
jgi:cytochrome c553